MVNVRGTFKNSLETKTAKTGKKKNKKSYKTVGSKKEFSYFFYLHFQERFSDILSVLMLTESLDTSISFYFLEPQRPSLE